MNKRLHIFFLFLTAMIWGTAFVAQRVGMDHMGPYTFNGIRMMLDAFQIGTDKAVYFGDDNDDIEPITKCGCGVAVANALPAVLAIADYVTGSNDEDGVAAYLSALLNGCSGEDRNHD